LKVILFLGYSNSGKTTALTSLARAIVKRRLGRVGTLKHIHHDPDFTIDTKGKDTWLHAASGASVVVSLAPKELAIIKKGKDIEELGIDQILSIFRREKVDYALIEGLYRKMSRKRGVVRILCASSAKQAVDLLNQHGSRGVVCITGRIASSRKKSLEGLPVFQIPRDAGKILSLILAERSRKVRSA
jgi:molybdopterin-guanine dinucleotide biosynthesis adapter protein